jgi:pimeloyl-ACP methyl ester carboxylesterase
VPIAAGIYYGYHEGVSKEKPPVVLVHGAGGDHLYWPPALRRLSGYRVFAPDLPGHGRSPGPGQQTIAVYAQRLLEFLTAVGLHSAVFVGHSMGGAITLHLALEHGEHVVGAVLVACGARLNVPPALIAATSRTATFPQGLAALSSMAFSPSASPRLVELGMRRLKHTRQAVLHGDLQACGAYEVANPQRLRALSVPLLVLSGEDDPLAPPAGANYLGTYVPHAQVAIFPSTGHMLMLEQPARTAAILRRFLDQLPYQVGQANR